MSHWGELLELIRNGHPAWHADGLCKEHPEVTWFPTKRESSKAAKEICRRCLVVQECARWSLEQPSNLQGVWGGLTQDERAAFRRGQEAA